MEKVWVNTDIGSDIDDGYALAYLLCRKDVEVVGVTTVSNDTVTRGILADAFCRAFGKEIPVYAGAMRSLCVERLQNNITPIHKKASEKYAEIYKTKLNIYEDNGNIYPDVSEAISAMRRAISENPGEITLLEIGPCTNTALLFSAYPETVELLKRVVVMGGSYFPNPRCTWNIEAEWNIIVDPEAAKIVFSSKPKEAYALGVDLTWDYQMSSADTFDALPKKDNLEPLCAVTEPRLAYPNVDPIWFHDSVAALVALEPERFNLTRGNVEVQISDGVRAKTILHPKEEGTWLVADKLKGGAEEFFEHYFGVLNS